ncbi:MAG TPA: VWA domain-containing protein [Vicinamibacterales bacterium]|nr:VWA domain-containing protein [Vicinamibacterales bacterium]
MSMRASSTGVAAIAAFAVALSAQQAGQNPPVFRSSVDVIQVDVSALDSAGHPVKGLTAADFTLLENNKPQEIVAFAEISAPDQPPLSAAWVRDVPPDIRTNSLGDGRLFAIILDDATIPPDLRMSANAREIGRGVIQRMGPDDLAAVIYVSDSRRSVDFTNDRGRLLAAIEAFTPGFAYSDQVAATDNQLFFSSIRTLGLVAGHLANVPQRRKAIIYVSTGAPVEASAIANIDKIGSRGAPALDTLSSGGTLEASTDREIAEALTELVESRPQEAYGAAVKQAFVRAQHGNVNIYSIDPAGVGGLEAFLQQRVRTARIGGSFMSPSEAMLQARMHRDFLQTIAENSGGRAIFGTNDLAKGLARIFEENGAYYLIGYQSTRNAADRTVRRVGVRVRRPGVTAKTRNAYFGARPAPPAASSPTLTPALASTLSGILPSPDVTLRAAASAFRMPGGRAGIVLATGVEQRVIGDAGARVLDQLEVLAAAFSADGRAQGTARQTARLALRAGLPDAAAYEVLSRIDLAPGRYQIRLAAHSAMSAKTGSVYFDLVVPDFNREALQVADLVLSVTPVVAAAPTDAAEAIIPVIPTSRRTFASTEAVLGFTRIYQGAGRAPSAATLTISITDTANKIVTRSSQQVSADTFVARQADCKFTLPVSTLDTGEYLLTVEVSQGDKPVTRYLRFTVKN